MPVVVIPTCFLDLANVTPEYAECRVEGRCLPSIMQELFQCYPALFTRFRDSNGKPRTNWFVLCRESDGDYLSDTTDLSIGEDDRIHLVNLIGC